MVQIKVKGVYEVGTLLSLYFNETQRENISQWEMSNDELNENQWEMSLYVDATQRKMSLNKNSLDDLNETLQDISLNEKSLYS